MNPLFIEINVPLSTAVICNHTASDTDDTILKAAGMQIAARLLVLKENAIAGVVEQLKARRAGIPPSIPVTDAAPLRRRSSGLLTTQEAAELLGLSQRSLYRHHEAGTGPAFVKLGSGRIRYERQAVLSWKQQNQRSNGRYPKPGVALAAADAVTA